MEIAYWVIAGLLAALYAWSGAKKLLQSRDALRPMMGWVDDVPLPLTRSIGAVEVAGAVGLLVPPLVGLLPWLAVVAAIGFVFLQLAAAGFHLSRDEQRQVPFNLLLMLLAAFAAWFATTVV
ncbi:DoxX family protein [Nocardioides sp. GY 10113]|uniref:DoxX family protein n=1 Tax=Nocardioides sp. GY 10113 TaxID=2569761 RepID=UPI0010A8B6EA|nr:DoxX family protein [Nocardioides sp. GY 10113]TIC88014.1 DoxX family protein [Nocardioides sp. GY 10113]